MLSIYQIIILIFLNVIAYFAGGTISSMAKPELSQFRKYIQFILVFLQVVSFIIMFQDSVIYAIILSVAAILFWFMKKTFSTTLAISAVTIAAGTPDARAIAFVVLLTQGIHDYELVMAEKKKTQIKIQTKIQTNKQTNKQTKKQEKFFASKILTLKKYFPRALMIFLFSAIFFALYFFITQ